MLQEFSPGDIWTVQYPVRYGGMKLSGRMTVIRLPDGSLLLHSPCEITPGLADELETLGPVRHIVAPGNFHHLHLPSAQSAYPEATTWICPGIDRKRPELKYDHLLGNESPDAWRDVLDQEHVGAARLIQEVVFFHRPSRTLIVVDLIEYLGDTTPQVDRLLRFWWKLFRTWNRPCPAPEYRMGWGERKKIGASLRRIMEWKFDKIILSHGDLIHENAHSMAALAWRKPLTFGLD